jgi:hypothetical protein
MARRAAERAKYIDGEPTRFDLPRQRCGGPALAEIGGDDGAEMLRARPLHAIPQHR